AGKYQEATEHLSLALELYAAEAVRQDDLATALRARGNTEEATRHANKSRDIRIEMAVMRCRLGEASLGSGDRAAARQHYLAAIELNSKQDEALDSLAAISLATGHPEEVIRLYSEPGSLQNKMLAYRNVGRAYAISGRWEEAANWFRKALGLPRLPPETQSNLHGSLALALHELEQQEAARTEFQDALRIHPRWLESTRQLAWSWATHSQESFRNGPLALHLAQQVCQARETPDPQSLDTLAAAYAELGRFPDAAATARKALAAASPPEQKPLAEQITLRLHLYESGHPYRTPSTR